MPEPHVTGWKIPFLKALLFRGVSFLELFLCGRSQLGVGDISMKNYRKPAFLKLSATYRYQKLEILKLSKNYRYRKMHQILADK